MEVRVNSTALKSVKLGLEPKQIIVSSTRGKVTVSGTGAQAPSNELSNNYIRGVVEEIEINSKFEVFGLSSQVTINHNKGRHVTIDYVNRLGEYVSVATCNSEDLNSVTISAVQPLDGFLLIR